MSSNPHGLVLPPELNPRGRHSTPRPRRRWARALSWTAVVMSVVVLLASLGGFLFVRYFDGQINRVGGLFGDDSKRPEAVGEAKNFLLVGSDSREGATQKELQQFSTTFEPGRRSDTIILIHLSKKQDKATLVSFPRDAYVPIPGAGEGKINTSFSRGGPALTIKTVEALTNVRIDHYIEVNFAGFFRMVEALDGVEVCLAKPAKEPLSGIDLPAGRSTIKGPQALAYVRQRHGLPGGDLGRIQRQQQFLGAMLQRATSAGVLFRPDKLLSFLKVVAQSIQVDENLAFGDMKDLAFRLKDLDPAKVQFMTAPVDRLAKRRGQSVVLLDEPASQELFTAIREDRVGDVAKPVGPTGGITVAPAQVPRLTVLNGTATKGFARTAAEALASAGFRIGTVANADTEDYEQTVVRYPAARADSAKTVLAALPGAKGVVDEGATSITVVLGTAYSGVKKVTVAATAAPGTKPTARPRTAADDPCAE